MLELMSPQGIAQSVKRLWYFWIIFWFVLAVVAPVIIYKNASGAQLTQRRLTLSSSASGTQTVGQNVNYDFEFNLGTSGNVGSIKIDFCTTPLGTCTTPTGFDASSATLNTSGDEINNVDAGFSNGTMATGIVRISRVAAAQTAGQQVEIDFNGIKNPTLSGNGTSFYARIVVYSDNAYTTTLDEGTVAGAIVDQITVSGRVQERLVFCVYALGDTAGSAAAGSGSGAMPTNCSATEANNGSEVDIGVIDNSTIAKSPVNNSPPSSLGNDTFGAAQVNTNASNGVVVTYYANQASSGTNQLRAFRVPGATCSATLTDVTDQCFVSSDESAGETFTAGTERFGIQIACVANNATAGTALGTTSNLGAGGSGTGATAGTVNTVYSNTDNSIADDGSDDCENSDSGVKFGWNDTSTSQALIHSSSVVDDEIVKMRFGATAQATTPTGSYTVSSHFIATATY